MDSDRSVTLSRFAAVLFLIIFIVVSFSTFTYAETAKEQKVTFNFVDVTLPTVTKFISEITGKNFIFDERVAGKITIIAPTQLSVDDAYSLFTSILELKGYTVVSSGVNAYKIVPIAEAKQKGISIATDKEPVNESFIARLIPLTNISSDDALKLVQPIVSRNGYVSDFGPGNLLLVIDSGLNIEKIVSIIEAVDQPSEEEMPEIVFLKHASAEVVAKMLSEGAGLTGRRIVRGQPPQAEENKAVADQRLNAVLLFGDKRTRDSMKSLISVLDVPAPEAQGRINVYFLENADANELVKVLEGLLNAPQVQKKTPAASAAPVTPFEAAGGITITADKSTNSLIVVASPSDYQNLVQVIKQLDRRRKQVYVEAMIVEASLDKLRELGTKWRIIGRSGGEPVGIGGFGTVDPSAVQSLIFGLSGLSGGGMGNFFDVPLTTIDPLTGEAIQTTLNVPGFAALFNLNEFKGAINVLSTPQILTSDNEEAEILVGENVPFITSRQRDVTTTNTVLSSVERTDVGIILRITPQITEGSYVKLNIFQEISAVKEENNSEILINVGPTTTKRSTSTSVVVKDNQTVVIGGLMEEKEEDSVSKLPVLGDIPLLGWLFKTKSISKKKTNLLVFITPHVIKDADDLEHITKLKEKSFAAAEKKYAEGELLVKFRDGVTDEQASEIISSRGASVIRRLDLPGVYHIKLAAGYTVEEAVRDFSSLPEVDYAEPNYTVRMQKTR